MDYPKTPILTHEDIDVIRRYNAIMDRPDVQELAKYHATEGRMNGVLEGVSSGKGGRAWLDGEWQLVELTALACHIRAITKADGGVPDDFGRELINAQPDCTKNLEDLCDQLKAHGPSVTGRFVKERSEWIGRFDSPDIIGEEPLRLLNELGWDAVLRTSITKFVTHDFKFKLLIEDKLIKYFGSDRTGGCGVFRTTMFGENGNTILIPIGNTLYSDLSLSLSRFRIFINPGDIKIMLPNGTALPDRVPADLIRDTIEDYLTRNECLPGQYTTNLSGKMPYGYLALTPVEKS